MEVLRGQLGCCVELSSSLCWAVYRSLLPWACVCLELIGEPGRGIESTGTWELVLMFINNEFPYTPQLEG